MGDALPWLADLASSQSAHDFPVGFQEVEAGQFVRTRPHKPFEFAILRHPRVPPDLEEKQADSETIWITIVGPVDLGRVASGERPISTPPPDASDAC
jgi:hypothetical protein